MSLPPGRRSTPVGAAENSTSVACICGAEFETPTELSEDEHVHCPACGSYYDSANKTDLDPSQLRWRISKRQAECLRRHREEWSEMHEHQGTPLVN
jgi:hypothetical protein